MAYKRILTIQDISCVGQCSMTVALPILSACGHETCILPTAVLSTHTGGFGKPAGIHLDEVMEPFLRHWKENNISFDAILVGYIGNIQGVRAVSRLAEELLASDGILIVDPAFADHGKVYSGLNDEYICEMKKLCCRADIILPNMTEAAIFSGCEYRAVPDAAYVKHLLQNLHHSGVVLTGVGYQPGQTGVLVWNGEQDYHYAHPKLNQNFHGTGDMFAACFTGALLQEKTMAKAVGIAADYVRKSIENTMNNPAHWYGVKFETALPDLIQMLNK